MLDELIQSNQTEFQVVAFKLGSEEYATQITCVKEVITPQYYTRIPESPGYITGVINLRGNIIPVIDGRKKFNLDVCEQQDTKENRIMIMDAEDGTVGIIVDNVLGVVRLKVDEIEPPPMDLNENNEIFWGIGRYQDKLLILINCYKCLALNNDKEIEGFHNITDIVKRTKNEERHSGHTKKSR